MPAYMPKPTKSDAMLVISTRGRAVVRRSTSGSLVRSSQKPHTRSATTEAVNRPIVVVEAQPHSAPLEMASSRQTRPTARPRAPGTSKRCPRAPAGTSGIRNQISAETTRARTAEPQNSTRQFAYWATAEAIGRPRAPPMPMEALTSAMDELSFSFGTTSRSREMPRGTMPIPMPWRPRPTIIGTTVDDRAQTTEPTTRGTAHAISIRRLPSRSPRRPEIGTHTAETSRVTVITQVAFEAVVSRSCGSSAMSGVTRVCMIAATVPARARVATTPPDLAVGRGASMKWAP
ncbi:hypothetical protein ASD51_19995 [Streptomyces sp. Root55]|nr:hypothetical protein ASD51_19995 [Streptomyces sp. Root55]